MQSIVLLSSVRRSLFSKETDRGAYLQQLMNFIREILQTNQGLHHPDNYHQFCRQLGRLKANYQVRNSTTAAAVCATFFFFWTPLCFWWVAFL